MTALVQADIDGERLDHAEIRPSSCCCRWPGNDTTRHTTSHRDAGADRQPDQRALLLRGPRGRLGAAVEEFSLGLSGENLPAHHHPPGRAPRRAAAGRREGRALSTTRPTATSARSRSRGGSTSPATPPPRRLRGRRARTTAWALAGASSAALDLRRASAPDSRHPGAGGPSFCEAPSSRRQADGL